MRFPVAILTQNDLLGLVGAPTVPSCPSTPDPAQPRCRWVAGTALLLAYALGAVQGPIACPQAGSCPKTMLCGGLFEYPATCFADDELARLRQSSFIAPVPGLPDPPPSCN